MNQLFSRSQRVSVAILAGASLMLSACSDEVLTPLATEPDNEKASCIDSVSARFDVVDGEPKLTELKDPDSSWSILRFMEPTPEKLCGEGEEGGPTTVSFVVSPEAATEMLTGVRELQMESNECTFLRESTVEREPCLYLAPSEEERGALEEAFEAELKGFQRDLPSDAEFNLMSPGEGFGLSEFKLIRFNE